MAKKKSQNPLFIMDPNGKDIEVSYSKVKLILNKYGLGAFYDWLENLYQSFLEVITTLTSIDAMKAVWDDFVYRLSKLQIFLAEWDKLMRMYARP